MSIVSEYLARFDVEPAPRVTVHVVSIDGERRAIDMTSHGKDAAIWYADAKSELESVRCAYVAFG